MVCPSKCRESCVQKIALPAGTEAETAAPELLWSYKALLRATILSYDAMWTSQS